MTWKVAIVTHGVLVLAWAITLIVYAVKLNKSRKAEAQSLIEVTVQRVRAENAENDLAACRDKIEVGGMSDGDLSDAVHDALRNPDPDNDPSDG